MQVIFSFTSHDLQLSSWSWIFSYLKFNLSTIVSKPFVHSTVIPQFQHSALDSKPLETVLVLYMACPLCCVFRPALGCAQHLTQNEYSPHIPTKSSSSPTTRAFDPYVTQFILFYFIYWARIKMNICDRWFAKKSKINTMLKNIRFT